MTMVDHTCWACGKVQEFGDMVEVRVAWRGVDVGWSDVCTRCAGRLTDGRSRAVVKNGVLFKMRLQPSVPV